jgi:hypothetical protein
LPAFVAVTTVLLYGLYVEFHMESLTVIFLPVSKLKKDTALAGTVKVTAVISAMIIIVIVFICESP